LWGFVRERVEAEVDWPIFEGLSTDGPFNRSRALNEAAVQAGDWDAAVILDADTVPDFDSVRRAVESASTGRQLVFAQSQFRSLTRAATRAVIAGRLEPADADARWVYPDPKSSCLVICRETWELVGGFDQRFEGWGGEDAALYAACNALVGVERLKGDCWHLWHSRSPEKNPDLPTYKANFELLARYKAARSDPEAMQAILAEPGGPRC
jgi:hypothetical protein